ncbi:MAG: hypothetical protein CMP31_09525 [Roseibacillus sp.]|nr:hypothetical protein [Roseibacillus sp.]|tara:strand:+ start:17477 stop:18421 length:945 start_codon:yes stop_codon:yes gene_type:complete
MKFGCMFFILVASTAILLSSMALGAKPGGPIWTDPARAAREDPDFSIQGEYAGKGIGVQIAALGDGNFYVSRFKGGLPGAGWDKSAPTVELAEKAGAEVAIGSCQKIHRQSPTLGKSPPKGADVLVGETIDPKLLKGKGGKGVLSPPAQSVKDYGDFTMHLEFRLPYKPKSPLSSQDRGNSGVYLQNRYEVQVLDSFGLVYDRAHVKVKIRSDPRQWCGCFYRFKTADLPMCLPPLAWQTYDIDFTAPRFDGEGKKTADATITVLHNGVKIHNAVNLPKGTGIGGTRPEVPRGPIIFQGHGNPVGFRNVWILER